MKKIKKIITIIIFFLGATSIAYAFYPPLGAKINELLLKPFTKKQIEEMSGKTDKIMKDILGETTQGGDSTLVKQIQQVPEKILTQEKVQEITTEINKVITEKVEETKALPQQGVEKAKEEIRKEIYKEVCGEWLK